VEGSRSGAGRTCEPFILIPTYITRIMRNVGLMERACFKTTDARINYPRRKRRWREGGGRRSVVKNRRLVPPENVARVIDNLEKT